MSAPGDPQRPRSDGGEAPTSPRPLPAVESGRCRIAGCFDADLLKIPTRRAPVFLCLECGGTWMERSGDSAT